MEDTPHFEHTETHIFSEGKVLVKGKVWGISECPRNDSCLVYNLAPPISGRVFGCTGGDTSEGIVPLIALDRPSLEFMAMEVLPCGLAVQSIIDGANKAHGMALRSPLIPLQEVQ